MRALWQACSSSESWSAVTRRNPNFCRHESCLAREHVNFLAQERRVWVANKEGLGAAQPSSELRDLAMRCIRSLRSDSEPHHTKHFGWIGKATSQGCNAVSSKLRHILDRC